MIDEANGEVVLCKATSPDDDACIKPKGHKSRWHQGQISGKRNKTKRWEGGTKTRPRWEIVDDGYMSEGDWYSWGRFLR